MLFWSCRYFKHVLKILENIQGKLCYGVSSEKIASLQITVSSLTLHVFKILENSWDNVCFAVPFYADRRWQVLYRIAALKNFFEKSQEGLRVY